jgi:hypothetical protein
MIQRIFLSAALLATPAAALAWDTFVEKEPDGRVFSIAEQVGDAGSFLHLVCFEREFHIEVIIPELLTEAETAHVFQIDGHAERLIGGVIETIDARTSVFIGTDRRDRPAQATKSLMKQIKSGNHLYMGDPDLHEAIEHWDLRGSTQAIARARENCK